MTRVDDRCVILEGEHFAAAFEERGFRCWAGVLNAADYGVPQTRRRAILMAHRDRPVHPPTPTHARGGEVTLFGELAPWVSMADALGWCPGEAGVVRGNNTVAGGPLAERRLDEPAMTLGSRVDQWVVDRRQTGAPPVPFSDPSPTIVGNALAKGVWQVRPDEVVLNPGATDTQPNRRRRPVTEPAPTIAFGHDAANWAWEMPATTVAGDPRITARCHHENGSQGADARTTEQVRAGDYDGTQPIKLTVADALVLQSFRADYPVQGSRSAQFLQVANAVPPRLAAHVLGGLL